MTRYEQETVIVLNNEEDVATVFTYRQKDNTKLRKLGFEPVETFRHEGKEAGFKYLIPKECVSFRKQRVKMTEQQRRKAAERLERARGRV